MIARPSSKPGIRFVLLKECDCDAILELLHDHDYNVQAALDTEEDLHGGVAKRMERIESGRPVNPLRRAGTDTNFVGVEDEGVETPYALA